MVRFGIEIDVKKLLFITGTRADFGKLEPLASSAQSAGFGIYFFVTGMHLLEKYGLTSIEAVSYTHLTLPTILRV